jgi:hypothetical protein
MLVVSNREPNLFLPIRYVDTTGPSSPRWPVAERSGARGHLRALAGLALAAALVGFMAGAEVSRPAGASAGARTGGIDAAPGEFRLGPGTLPPPGVVVSVD